MSGQEKDGFTALKVLHCSFIKSQTRLRVEPVKVVGLW